MVTAAARAPQLAVGHPYEGETTHPEGHSLAAAAAEAGRQLELSETPPLQGPSGVVVDAPDSARLGSRPSFGVGLLVPLLIGLILAGAVFGLTNRRPAGWWVFPLNED